MQHSVSQHLRAGHETVEEGPAECGGFVLRMPAPPHRAASGMPEPTAPSSKTHHDASKRLACHVKVVQAFA